MYMNELQLMKDSSENLKWFLSNVKNLKDKYGEDILAIKSREVIANASNMKDLMLKLKKLKVKKEEVLIKQIPSKKKIKIFQI